MLGIGKKSVVAAGLAMAVLPAPVSAVTPVSACDLSYIAGATDCAGNYAGNLLRNPSFQDQVDALATIGFTLTGNWSTVDATKIGPTGGNLYTFAVPLSGISYIGIHFGNAGNRSSGTDFTAFYRLDTATQTSFTFNREGGSSAVLYTTGMAPPVPEPATWLMMLVGFAAAGAALRRRGKRTVSGAIEPA